MRERILKICGNCCLRAKGFQSIGQPDSSALNSDSAVSSKPGLASIAMTDPAHRTASDQPAGYSSRRRQPLRPRLEPPGARFHGWRNLPGSKATTDLRRAPQFELYSSWTNYRNRESKDLRSGCRQRILSNTQRRRTAVHRSEPWVHMIPLRVGMPRGDEYLAL